MDTENKYGTLEIQKASVELLKKFSMWAEQNNVSYSLVDGSMLGAVRHGGFIPWDDDIDIIVKRDTYNELVAQKYNEYGFEIVNDLWLRRIRSLNTDAELSYPATIDIFVLDKAPDSELARKIKLFLVYMIQGMMKKRLSLQKGNIVIKVCTFITWLLGLPFSYDLKFKWYGSISSLWGGEKYCHCCNTIYAYIHQSFDGDVMDSLVYLPFEDLMQPVMSKYDHWLTCRYGDYMTPPIEKKPKHLN